VAEEVYFVNCQMADKGHEFYMRACIDLALQAKSRGDSPVGAVVVQDGTIIAEGIEASKTKKDITYHAEVEAIREANIILGTTDLSDCTLYTTHEPCILCSYAIRHSKINTVVFGISTVETGGVHSFYPLLTDTKIKKWGKAPRIVKGILERDIKNSIV
jgi:tRNA(adenine34) deaminase